MNDRKLFLSNTNKMLGGVCGGIGETYNLDPTIVRLVWVLASIFFGVGIGGLIVYLIAWMIIPPRQ